MTAREIAIKAAQITAVASLLLITVHSLKWIGETDRQVSQGMQEAYCAGVATWQAEAARGVPEAQRTGHPDWRENAAERCPGLRPAAPITTERQLAAY
ncbi:hypothetical protein [uncultured Halomonas sp.]|uniref:hypothetical protein n=1 Tax=uncultured Halomonas sp. TaxID=173971 RepID=UPI0026170BEE|nr:hypothetical protein [uncultured Halomonas sp.]